MSSQTSKYVPNGRPQQQNGVSMTSTPASNGHPLTLRPAKAAASYYALPPRLNGFEKPFHTQQKAVWICVFITFAAYFSLILPFIPRPEHDDDFYAAIGVYFGLIVFGVPAYIQVQRVDPAMTAEESEPYATVASQHSSGDRDMSIVSSTSNPRNSPAAPGNHLVARACDKCNMFMGPRTKHCHLCRKCVNGFDHHCLYLNTCVGSKNYKVFMLTITTTTFLLAWQLSLAIDQLTKVGNGTAEYVREVENSGLHYRGVYIALLIVMSIIPTIFFLLIFFLWSFHVYLILRSQTTYEWIIASRAQESEKAQQKEAVERSLKAESLNKERSQIESQWREERAKEAERKKKAAAAASGGHSVSSNSSPKPQAPGTTTNTTTGTVSSSRSPPAGATVAEQTRTAANNTAPHPDEAKPTTTMQAAPEEVELAVIESQPPQSAAVMPAESVAIAIASSESSAEANNNAAAPAASTLVSRPSNSGAVKFHVVGGAAPLSPNSMARFLDHSQGPSLRLTINDPLQQQQQQQNIAEENQTADADAVAPSPLSPRSAEEKAATEADADVAVSSTNPLLSFLVDASSAVTGVAHHHAPQVSQNAGTHQLPLPPYLT